MQRFIPPIAAALTMLLLAPTAHAQQQPAQATGGLGGQAAEEVANPAIGPLFGPPFGDQHLFGDWGGARTWLDDHGVTVSLDYLQETAGNVNGGRGEGVTYTSQIGLGIDLDLGKLAGLPGFAIHSMIVQGNGRSLSSDRLGDDLDAVQEIYGGRGDVLAHLVYLYAEKAAADNRIDVAAGWLPVGTYFASSPIYCEFVNVIACGNPHPLPVYPGEPDWPAATWGGQIRYLTTPHTYIMAGLFDVQPNFGGRSGWNMTTNGSTGISIPVEIGWVPTFGPNGLIGHYKFGFDEDTSSYPDQFTDVTGNDIAVTGLPGAAHHGRRMYYVLLDQMLHRNGKGDTNGLIVFGGWLHADADVSPLENHFFAGAIDTGAAFGRPQDTFGFEWNWFTVSGQLTRTQQLEAELGMPLTGGGLGPVYGAQSEEQTLELMYSAQVWRGINVEPNIQYVIRPGGTSATPDALVLGLQTNVAF